MNVAEDPYLSSVIDWDAQVLEKFDGKEWVRFYDEPSTAQYMWDIQVVLFLRNCV